MTNSQVSADGLSALSRLLEGIATGEPVALDPSDPAHRGAIEAALEAAGRTPDRYPALHAALDGGATAAADGLTLLDQGADRSGRATAMTLQAAGEGHVYSGGTLFAFDADSGALLAQGDNSNVGDGLVPISTRTATARPAGEALRVLSINHSVTQAGDVRFTALATVATPIVSGDMTFNIDQPTLTPKNGSYVQVAVGRDDGHTNKDVDYWYLNQGNDDNPYLICPFWGTAVLPYDVDGTPSAPLPGAAVSAFIYVSTGGSAYAYPVDTYFTRDFANRVKMDSTNSAMVTWDYQYQEGSYYTNTTSIVYNRCSLLNTSSSFFVFNFAVPVTGSPISPYPFTVCSVNTPEESSPNCHKILRQLMFVTHCIARGTLVTLADGSTAPIETLDNSHRVRTGGAPGDLAVEATTHGLHQADADADYGRALYRLTTDSGHELVATGLHPIQIPDGLAQLDSLAAGDEVVTDDGTARVAACEQVGSDGTFHNLKLGDEADRAAGLDADSVCTFVANGIVVGDLASLRA
ncbi:MAG TPA: Hint domain-containing protein, partial [Allosphingosinicella sp.]|nr:Hint domain-containing protein [Allosphingosinicella sp.]